MKDQVIAVWFSCGAASAVAAKKTLELHGKDNTVRVLNSPVKEEDEDNRRFLKDIESWLGVRVETVINPKYPDCSAETVWRDRKYMSHPKGGAPCTVELKKRARQIWEKNNHVDWHVLGFVAEERGRHERFVLSERDNVLPVLIDLNISKPECAQIISEAGIQLPRMYRLGFPNANCKMCVKATSPTYFNAMRRHFPDEFQRRADLEQELGANLVRVKGERIQLHDLDPSAEGAPLKSIQHECGLFCEEAA